MIRLPSSISVCGRIFQSCSGFALQARKRKRGADEESEEEEEVEPEGEGARAHAEGSKDDGDTVDDDGSSKAAATTVRTNAAEGCVHGGWCLNVVRTVSECSLYLKGESM